MKTLKEGFLSREELIERVEPLIDEIDEFEAANRNDCYITWNFGQDRDGNVTAGVDLVVDGEDASEENIKGSLEAIFKKHGFGLDDNIKHENPIRTLLGAWHYQIKEMDYEDWHDTADQEQVDQPDYTPELVDDDMNAGFWYESLEEATLAESAPDRITKKFDSSQKAREFMNSLPKEAEARMEQSDTEEEGNYKTWWEVSYWETPSNVDESLSWENDHEGGFNSLANKILPINDLGTMTPNQLARVEGRRDELWHKEDDGTITPEEVEELKELTKKIEDHYTKKRELMGECTDNMLTESKEPTKDDIIDWLSEHDQAWEDACDWFGSADLSEIDYDDIISWIFDHDMLSDDLMRHFGKEHFIGEMEGLDEDLASLFQHIHDTDEYNWNLHGTDYTPFYDELKQYMKPGETWDAEDDMGWSADTNVDLATLFRRMPKDKQMDFMNRFYIREGLKKPLKEGMEAPFQIDVFFNSAAAERRPLEPDDIDDVEHYEFDDTDKGMDDFYETLADFDIYADEDGEGTQDILRKLELQDYGDGSPIVYKVVAFGDTIYDDSDYFESLFDEIEGGDWDEDDWDDEEDAMSESLKPLKEGMETVRADLESIEKFLNENGKSIWWDVYNYDTAPMGTSRIDFQVEGDWKHDHWAFKDLIQEWADKNGRKIFKIDSQEVGESDSDNYTAIYSVYIAKDEESFNTLNSMRALFAEDFDGNFTGLNLEG